MRTRPRSLIMLPFLLSLLAGCPIQAADFSAGLSAGYNVLNGAAGNLADDGFAPGAFAAYNLNANSAIEASITFSSHDDVVDTRGATTVDLWLITLGPKFSFAWRGARPYCTLGPGFYLVDLAYAPELPDNPPDRAEKDSEAGIFAGLGIDMPLGGHVCLGFEIRYHAIFNDDVLDGDIIGTRIRIGFD